MKIKKKALIFGLLAISPLGVPFLYMILDATGLCVSTAGGMVTSVTCSVPFGSYLAWAGEQFTNSFLLIVPGLLWLIASVTIWVYALLYISLVLLGKGEMDASEIGLLSTDKNKTQRSFLFRFFQAILLLMVIAATVTVIVVAADYFELV